MPDKDDDFDFNFDTGGTEEAAPNPAPEAKPDAMAEIAELRKQLDALTASLQSFNPEAIENASMRAIQRFVEANTPTPATTPAEPDEGIRFDPDKLKESATESAAEHVTTLSRLAAEVDAQFGSFLPRELLDEIKSNLTKAKPSELRLIAEHNGHLGAAAAALGTLVKDGKWKPGAPDPQFTPASPSAPASSDPSTLVRDFEKLFGRAPSEETMKALKKGRIK